MRPLFILIACFLLTVPALAGETAWQDVAPGVRLRMISADQVKANGTALVALEVDMPENTKTYWRVPGDTGFPMELDFSGSSNIGNPQVLWPFPTRDQTDDYLDYVYYGSIIIPVEVEVDGPDPSLSAAVTLGVCSDICIPAQASFDLPLKTAEPDRINGLRIRQALAAVPIAWTDDPAPFGAAALSSDGRHLAVRINDPSVHPDSLIVSTASGEPVFGAPQKSPEPNLVILPLLGEGAKAALGDQDIQLTFMTDMGAYEISRSLGKATGDEALQVDGSAQALN